MSPEIGVGDIVTRDGTDKHLVYGINESGDLLDVVCIKEPSSPWTHIGETESNLTRRYSLLEKAIYKVIDEFPEDCKKAERVDEAKILELP
jgi:hypothetical protein